jgi:hypothetical protein
MLRRRRQAIVGAMASAVAVTAVMVVVVTRLVTDSSAPTDTVAVDDEMMRRLLPNSAPSSWGTDVNGVEAGNGAAAWFGCDPDELVLFAGERTVNGQLAVDSIPDIGMVTPNRLTYLRCEEVAAVSSPTPATDTDPLIVGDPAVGYGPSPGPGFGQDVARAEPGFIPASSAGRQCVVGEVVLNTGPVANGIPADGRRIRLIGNEYLAEILGPLADFDGSTLRIPDLRPITPNGMTYSFCHQGVLPERQSLAECVTGSLRMGPLDTGERGAYGQRADGSRAATKELEILLGKRFGADVASGWSLVPDMQVYEPEGFGWFICDTAGPVV